MNIMTWMIDAWAILWSFFKPALAIFGTVLGIAWFLDRRFPTPDRVQEARREDGLCILCGYCLTGNTSGICPECGSDVAGR